MRLEQAITGTPVSTLSLGGTPQEPRAPLVPRRPGLGAMSVLAALDWAFRRERVELELRRREPPEERGQGFGMEYVLIQRAKLGVSIDSFGPPNWGGSTPHEDAEVIAAILSGLPSDLGGSGMAVRVAEFARAGRTPPWQDKDGLRCVASALHQGRGGLRGVTEVVGRGSYYQRGRVRQYDMRVCPVEFVGDSRRTDSLRAAYRAWWLAVVWLSHELRDCRMLRQVRVTPELPPSAPWSAEG